MDWLVPSLFFFGSNSKRVYSKLFIRKITIIPFDYIRKNIYYIKLVSMFSAVFKSWRAIHFIRALNIFFIPLEAGIVQAST